MRRTRISYAFAVPSAYLHPLMILSFENRGRSNSPHIEKRPRTCLNHDTLKGALGHGGDFQVWAWSNAFHVRTADHGEIRFQRPNSLFTSVEGAKATTICPKCGKPAWAPYVMSVTKKYGQVYHYKVYRHPDRRRRSPRRCTVKVEESSG